MKVLLAVDRGVFWPFADFFGHFLLLFQKLLVLFLFAVLVVGTQHYLLPW